VGNLCTWNGCQDVGTVDQRDRTGALWATLCPTHSAELDKATENFDPSAALRAWVKASGGATNLAKRATDDIARTAEALMQGGRVKKR
jgi:hypothetical protein